MPVFSTSVWSFGPPESDLPYRVWAARRTVRMHTEWTSPPVQLPHDGRLGAEPARATGRCKACPADELEVCTAFRCAIRVLLNYAGIACLYRAV